jgi:hypothetical protein
MAPIPEPLASSPLSGGMRVPRSRSPNKVEVPVLNGKEMATVTRGMNAGALATAEALMQSLATAQNQAAVLVYQLRNGGE